MQFELIYFDVSIALSWMNAILAGSIVWLGIARIGKYGGSKFTWMTLVLGAYWSILYFYIALAGMTVLFSPVDPILFGKIFVRPAFTLTLTVMALSSLRQRNRINGKHK
jgi:hypothetical protein